MADLVERQLVTVKTPIFYGTERERLVSGESRLTQPFVELWSEFQITGFEATRQWRSEVHLGLRESRSGLQYYGDNNFTEPDPLKLFRALQILDRLNNLDPHRDLRDVYAAAGVTGILSFDRYIRNRVSTMIGRDVFKEISQSIPANLAEVVKELRKEKLPIDTTTLEKEIRRGRVQQQPLYERVIHQVKQRQVSAERSLEYIF